MARLKEDFKEGSSRISTELLDSSNHLHSNNRAGFTKLSSQLTDLESAREGRNEILDSRWNVCVENSNHYMKSLEKVSWRQTNFVKMNRTGFQEIESRHAEAISYSREAHETTHGMLSRYHDYLQQLVRFSTTRQIVTGRESPKRKLFSAASVENLERRTVWKHYTYTLPLGRLLIFLKSTQDHSHAESLAKRLYTVSDMRVTFVPPSCSSDLALICTMKHDHDLITSEWDWGARLKTATVNSNTIFLKALVFGRFEDLKTSFEKGFAQPTDYVCQYDFKPLRPWYEVRLLPTLYEHY